MKTGQIFTFCLFTVLISAFLPASDHGKPVLELDSKLDKKEEEELEVILKKSPRNRFERVKDGYRDGIHPNKITENQKKKNRQSLSPRISRNFARKSF